MVSQCEQ